MMPVSRPAQVSALVHVTQQNKVEFYTVVYRVEGSRVVHDEWWQALQPLFLADNALISITTITKGDLTALAEVLDDPDPSYEQGLAGMSVEPNLTLVQQEAIALPNDLRLALVCWYRAWHHGSSQDEIDAANVLAVTLSDRIPAMRAIVYGEGDQGA